MKSQSRKINQEALPAMEAVLAYLSDKPDYSNGISGLRDMITPQNGCDFPFHYPISDGTSLGGYVMPVQEGFLWLPYHEADRRAGEVLELSGSRLLTGDDCDVLLSDFKHFAQSLFLNLKTAKSCIEHIGKDADDEQPHVTPEENNEA